VGWEGKGRGTEGVGGRRWGGCVGKGLWVMGFRENHIRNIYKYDRCSAGPLLLALFLSTRFNPPFELSCQSPQIFHSHPHPFPLTQKSQTSPPPSTPFTKSSKPSPHPLFSFIQITVDAGGRRSEENFCSKRKSMVIEKGVFGR